MVLTLAVMVGYMYWQQNKVLQAVGALNAMMMVQNVPHEKEDDEEEEEEDDRVSVDEESDVEVVQGPPTVQKDTQEAEDDEDDVHNKTATQLKELLTKKGIPFGKRDSKNVLLQLVKATS